MFNFFYILHENKNLFIKFERLPLDLPQFITNDELLQNVLVTCKIREVAIADDKQVITFVSSARCK